MSKPFETIIKELAEQLNGIESEAKAIEIKNIYYRDYIKPLYGQLGLAPTAKKKEVGILINKMKTSFDEIIAKHLAIISIANENKKHIVNYDLTINTYHALKGSLHPLTIVANEIIAFFQQLNFQIVSGNELVPIKYNFDYLNIDKNHPARTPQESFYIANSDLMLRVHCTAVTAQIINNNKSQDIRVVTFGNVYRNDEDDATHSHQFSQIDIVWIKDGINLANLK